MVLRRRNVMNANRIVVNMKDVMHVVARRNFARRNNIMSVGWI